MAIITVSDLNTFLGEFEVTNAKTAAVNAANAYIERYCDRRFVPNVSGLIREWHYIEGVSSVQAHFYPVVSVLRVGDDAKRLMRVWAVGFDDATISTHGNAHRFDYELIIRQSYNAAWNASLFGLDNAEYDSINELVSDINSRVGWQAELINNDVSMAIRPVEPQSCLNTPIDIYGPGNHIEVISVDRDSGIIQLASSYSGWLYLEYYTDYSSVAPDDLKQLACEIANTLLNVPQYNSMFVSESIGDYSYRLREGVVNPLEQYNPRLNLYRRWTL